MNSELIDEQDKLVSLYKEAWDLAWLEKRPRHAISVLRKVMLADSKFARAQLEVARIVVHFLPNHIHIAQTAINSFLLLDPRSASGHFYKGIIRAAQGHADESETCYRIAIDLDPFHISAKNCLGLLLVDSGRIDEGLTLLEQNVEFALCWNPTSGEWPARWTLASAYDKCGRIAEADEQWRQLKTLLSPVDDDDKCASFVLNRVHEISKRSAG